MGLLDEKGGRLWRDAGRAMGTLETSATRHCRHPGPDDVEGLLYQRHQGLRRTILRHFRPRSRADGPAATHQPRGCLRSPGARGHPATEPRRIGCRRHHGRQLGRLFPAHSRGLAEHRRIHGHRDRILRHPQPHLARARPCRPDLRRGRSVRVLTRCDPPGQTRPACG
ncbi:hypothetical protein MPH_12535 [Macrophomina phaseolina MS6]|uniref:Uncharacterized protein n=1 Tax=Macrophomina phaseolina (strain MS6) TaxID=1126212 RepID=K2QKR2_MACPH|nr:hypothetical protein MPH_12535 [Macrophomina phaseolina MS6]